MPRYGTCTGWPSALFPSHLQVAKSIVSENEWVEPSASTACTTPGWKLRAANIARFELTPQSGSGEFGTISVVKAIDAGKYPRNHEFPRWRVSLLLVRQPAERLQPLSALHWLRGGWLEFS